MSVKDQDPDVGDVIGGASTDDELLNRMNNDLLRQTLREHGQRLTLLEDKLVSYIEEMRNVLSVVQRSNQRTKSLAKALGVTDDGE